VAVATQTDCSILANNNPFSALLENEFLRNIDMMEQRLEYVDDGDEEVYEELNDEFM
jgi:hypothetical protein